MKNIVRALNNADHCNQCAPIVKKKKKINLHDTTYKNKTNK